MDFISLWQVVSCFQREAPKTVPRILSSGEPDRSFIGISDKVPGKESARRMLPLRFLLYNKNRVIALAGELCCQVITAGCKGL